MANNQPLKSPMTVESIEARLKHALNDRQLADVMRDVRARLAVEKADPQIIEAVDALEREHTARVYIGGRAG